MPFDPNKIQKFPKAPGVYLMKNREGVVLYVGKANDLRVRVRQYFAKSGDTRPSIPFLLAKTEEIDTIVVRTEKEALLLENNLIKQHHPPYNILLRDDKSYMALKMTTKHPWPRLEIVRYKHKPKEDGVYFGPYTAAFAARETYDLIQKIFPIRECSDQELKRRTRPCILHQMGRCLAPCVHLCTKENYDRYVKEAMQFLSGKNKQVIKDLISRREEASAALEFEKAAEIQRMIERVEKTVEKQGVDFPLGSDLDAWSLYREGDELTLTVLSVRGGKLMGTEHASFSKVAHDDDELLEPYLLQYYEGSQNIPKEILLPFTLKNAGALSEILTDLAVGKVSVFTPVRGAKKAFLELAASNAKAEFSKKRNEADSTQKILLEMQERFDLTRFPDRIECFDTSHTAGEALVSVMVVFVAGKAERRSYRKYKILSTEKADDYAALREVLARRYRKAKEENGLPDLIIIDGGKGHLNTASSVLEELDISTVDLIAVAKEGGRHDKSLTNEQIFLPARKDPIHLHAHSPLLFYLQRIRDEAHRFAIAFHKEKSLKGKLSSELDSLQGIGPVKKKRLLSHFGSVKRIKEATEEELRQVEGLTSKDIQTLLEFGF